MNYIPVEKLIAEIERRKVILDKYKDSFETAACCMQELERIKDFITALQQEQPKFKVGDTIHKKGENTVFPIVIERISNGDYVCDNAHSFINVKYQDDYELVHQEQPEPSNNLVDVDAVREDFITEVYRVLDADPTNDRANAIINAFDSLPTVSQEQPEVDLEKEITPSLVENMLCEFGVQSIDDMDSENLAEFARHFWNKGYIAGKEGTK